MIGACFINSGILGQTTFARFIRNSFPAADTDDLRVTQIVLTDGLTTGDRVIRRMLCQRVWPDGLAGMKNLDLLRYRAELHAGLLAERRIRRLEASGARFDVLHYHRQSTAYAALARMRGTPTIISIDTTQRAVLQTAQRALERRTYRPNVRRDGEIFRAAKLIVSTSRWALDCLREEYPDCATETLVLPNPVELGSFVATWVDERYARAARAAGYHPKVLFIGADFARKGGFDLLAAWRAGKFHQRASLDLVTGWPLEPGQLPEGASLHARVAAHTPEWQALWRDADVFALPTRDEAFGLVFQEAAAAGLPAIGTRLNAVPEIVQDGESGLLVAPGDIAALTRALDELISSAERRRELGAKARERIAVSADPAAYRGCLVAAIHRLAGR